jgi:hypothetical protein
MNGILSSGSSLLIHLFTHCHHLTHYLAEVIFYHLQTAVLKIVARDSTEYQQAILKNFAAQGSTQVTENAYFSSMVATLSPTRVIESFLLILNATGTFFASKKPYKPHVNTFFEFTFPKIFDLIRDQQSAPQQLNLSLIELRLSLVPTSCNSSLHKLTSKTFVTVLKYLLHQVSLWNNQSSSIQALESLEFLFQKKKLEKKLSVNISDV